MLAWDDTFALARILMKEHPEVDLSAVSLSMINSWVLQLPNFKDDPDLVNDEILKAIYQEWYEEINPI